MVAEHSLHTGSEAPHLEPPGRFADRAWAELDIPAKIPKRPPKGPAGVPITDRTDLRVFGVSWCRRLTVLADKLSGEVGAQSLNAKSRPRE